MNQNHKLNLILGWISIVTPWLCALAVLSFPPSISVLYFTTGNICLYAPLMISGTILILYRGQTTFENVLTTIAGSAAFGICFFPCSFTDVNFAFSGLDKIGVLRLPQDISSVIHTIITAIFFTVLSFITCVLYSDTGKLGKKRNMIYRICGLGSIAAIYLNQIPGISTWTMELVAMTFLGVAWLTRANKYKWLFADKVNKKIKKNKDTCK